MVKQGKNSVWADKNAQIAESVKNTRERRKTQTCKVFELKLSQKHITKTQKQQLQQLFLEAKWIYNDALSQENPTKYVPSKTVFVLNKDGVLEERELSVIGSQMKQSIITDIKTSLKTLKNKGGKIGRLRFKRQCNSITLKQYGTTHRIDFARKRVSIQRITGSFKVHGLNQIPEKSEIANARLVRKPSGFYLMITVFINKDDVIDCFVPETTIGVDMGVSTHLTLSNGEKFSVLVEQSPRIRRIQKSMQRQYDRAKTLKKKHGLDYLPLSKNYFKNKMLLLREYEKMGNRKKNLAHQISHAILRNEHVFMQDEQLGVWKIRFGKTIHHSVLGRVKENLSQNPRVHVLDKMKPTTQWCDSCGTKTKTPLGRKTHVCSVCGVREDRDIHAARNMIKLGAKEYNIPVEHGESTPVIDRIHGLCHIIVCGERDINDSVQLSPSLKQETNPSLVGW